MGTAQVFVYVNSIATFKIQLFLKFSKPLIRTLSLVNRFKLLLVTVIFTAWEMIVLVRWNQGHSLHNNFIYKDFSLWFMKYYFESLWIFFHLGKGEEHLSKERKWLSLPNSLRSFVSQGNTKTLHYFVSKVANLTHHGEWD